MLAYASCVRVDIIHRNEEQGEHDKAMITLVVSRGLPLLMHIRVESLMWIIRCLSIIHLNSVGSNRSGALAWYVVSLPDSFHLKL